MDAVQSKLKMGREAVGKIGVSSVLNVGFAYFDYRSRIQQGQNPVVAGAIAAGSGYLAATMGFLPFMAVTMGPGLMKSGVQAYHNYYQSHSAYSRRMTLPFSHTFQHTDATYQAQVRGLQALGGGGGAVAAEAGMMHQLYGRR